MIHRRGGASLFDLQPLREFRFDLAGGTITDTEALSGIAALAPAVNAMRDAAAPIDSPMHTLFEISPRPTVRSRSGGAAVDDFGALDGRLAGLERDRRAGLLDEHLDGPGLDELVGDIRAARVDPGSRRALQYRLAVLLRTAGRYRDALIVHERLGADDADGVESRNDAAVEMLKERALCHRRLGEDAASVGDEPELEWAEASKLLAQALELDSTTADTHGVAAGLEKRRADRAIQRGDRLAAKERLRRAAEHYAAGTDLDPTNYYLLLNRTTSLRLLGQHFGDRSCVDKARELLPVATYFAERANESDQQDVYAAASLGELVYTRLRLDPDADDIDLAFDEAEGWYMAALARGAGDDQRRAMAAQLAIYELLDGENAGLTRLRARVSGG